MKTWIVAVAMLLLGAILGVGVFAGLPKPLDEAEESNDSKVIQSIQREDEVVLVSLGIQGLAEERIASTVFGKTIPGTGRVLFLQYNYDALLGIDGSDVSIRPTGENAYTISIPRFIFIGHDDVVFKTAVEQNGVLSWVTPEIDTAEVISEILNDEAQRKHVSDNLPLLKDQAEAFYGGIIHGIDPAIQLTFEFADAS